MGHPVPGDRPAAGERLEKFLPFRDHQGGVSTETIAVLGPTIMACVESAESVGDGLGDLLGGVLLNVVSRRR